MLCASYAWEDNEKQVNEEISEGEFFSVFLALPVYYVSGGVMARMELVSAETNV